MIQYRKKSVKYDFFPVTLAERTRRTKPVPTLAAEEDHKIQEGKDDKSEKGKTSACRNSVTYRA